MIIPFYSFGSYGIQAKKKKGESSLKMKLLPLEIAKHFSPDATMTNFETLKNSHCGVCNGGFFKGDLFVHVCTNPLIDTNVEDWIMAHIQCLEQLKAEKEGAAALKKNETSDLLDIECM